MVILSHTSGMKTAISIPNELYAAVERRVGELGISRSEFYARGARRYLDELADGDLTMQINAAIEAMSPEELAEDERETRGWIEAGKASAWELLKDDEW